MNSKTQVAPAMSDRWVYIEKPGGYPLIITFPSPVERQDAEQEALLLLGLRDMPKNAVLIPRS